MIMFTTIIRIIERTVAATATPTAPATTTTTPSTTTTGRFSGNWKVALIVVLGVFWSGLLGGGAHLIEHMVEVQGAVWVCILNPRRQRIGLLIYLWNHSYFWHSKYQYMLKEYTKLLHMLWSHTWESLHMQLQHPEWDRVVVNSGLQPNIIPYSTSIKYCIQSETMESLKPLTDKVIKCFKAGATAMGWMHNEL